MDKRILMTAALALILLAAIAFAITDIYSDYFAKWDKEQYPDGYIVITERGGDMDIHLNVSEQVFDATKK